MNIKYIMTHMMKRIREPSLQKLLLMVDWMKSVQLAYLQTIIYTLK